MEREIVNKSQVGMPDFIQNMNISMNLEGWSATVAIVAVCLTSVTICFMKTMVEI